MKLDKKILKEQADRNFKGITKVHVNIMLDRQARELRQRLESWARVGVNENEREDWNNLLNLLISIEETRKSDLPKEKKKLRLVGKCAECGKQRYGFFRTSKDRITDLFYEQLCYQDPTDPTGSTWVFYKDWKENPDKLLDLILERLK